jgi:uncharacterized membrane protein
MWFLFSILTAFFESIKDVYSKKSLIKVDEYVVAWSIRVFALPFLIIPLLFTGIPTIKTNYWIALLTGGTLNVGATVLYMKALKYSDLSISVPMVTFTPAFLLLTSPVLVGEFPNITGIMGITLIVCGSYVLNIKQGKKGVLKPFKHLINEKGPKYMLLVAFIWSITSNIDKIGIKSSSIVFWIISINFFSSVILTPLLVVKKKSRQLKLFECVKLLSLVGFFAALRSIFQMWAIYLTLVAYVISIKRYSVIFSIIFGYIIFKEKGIRERLIGAILMVLGVFLIVLT